MDSHFLWIHTKDWWSWHLRRYSLWLKMWLKFSHSGSFYWIPFCVDSLHVSLFFSGDNNKCLTMSILTRLVGVILSNKFTLLSSLDDCGQWVKTCWREHKRAYSYVIVIFCWERSETPKYFQNINFKKIHFKSLWRKSYPCIFLFYFQFLWATIIINYFKILIIKNFQMHKCKK